MIREWLTQRDARLTEARALLDGAEQAGRGLSDEERTAYDAAMNEVASLNDAMKRREALIVAESVRPSMPAVNRIGRGDSEERALAHYIRTGDRGALGELRASNATDMNIGTPADGGYAVPTGHYNAVIAKRDEAALFQLLGCMPIPGRGTTVNVPTEAGTANVFVSTAETVGFDLDAPALGQAPMTLVKFTKKVVLSDELLEDEDSNLLAFLSNYVGRALATTHNSALVTEALANGTSVTLAGTGATAGDPETMIYSLSDFYADRAAWVMKRATEGAYRKLTGSDFLYQATPNGAERSLGGFPVYNSAFVAAVGSGNKSSILGNFEFMGVRQTGLTFLRDPYGAAATGQVNLFYYTRVVYKILNAAAILYGKHPTA